MRINEDFLDDEVYSGIGTEDVYTGNKEESSFAYRFIFTTTKALTPDNYSQDDWNTAVDEFFVKFYRIFDRLLILDDYYRDFSLYCGWGDNEIKDGVDWNGNDKMSVSKVIKTENGHTVVVSNRYTDTTHCIKFAFSFDANLGNLNRIRTLVISLWNAFCALCAQTFIPKPQSITLVKDDSAYYKETLINKNNYNIWMAGSSDDISRKRYMRFLRDVNLDMTLPEAKKMIAEFCEKSGSSDISPFLDKMNKQTKGVMRKYIAKGLANVRLENGIIIITKETLPVDLNDMYFMLMKTDVEFRFDGVRKVEYYANSKNTKESMIGIRNTFSNLSKLILNDDWIIVMTLGRGKFFEQFISNMDKTIDLTTLTDKKIIMNKKYVARYMSRSVLPYYFKTQRIPLTFHVKDSEGVHEVKLSPADY